MKLFAILCGLLICGGVAATCYSKTEVPCHATIYCAAFCKEEASECLNYNNVYESINSRPKELCVINSGTSSACEPKDTPKTECYRAYVCTGITEEVCSTGLYRCAPAGGLYFINIYFVTTLDPINC